MWWRQLAVFFAHLDETVATLRRRRAIASCLLLITNGTRSVRLVRCTINFESGPLESDDSHKLTLSEF